MITIINIVLIWLFDAYYLFGLFIYFTFFFF